MLFLQGGSESSTTTNPRKQQSIHSKRTNDAEQFVQQALKRSLEWGWVVEQKILDVMVRPDRIESLLQDTTRLVVALLLEAIVELSLVPFDRRDRIRGIAVGL